jgi:hypothetical protein
MISPDHPCRGRTRRVVPTVDRLQRVETAARLGKIEPDQSRCGEVVADDRFGHKAPSAAGQQQSVLGAKIGQSPRLSAQHPDILTFGERRSHRQDELSVPACFPG